MTRSVTDVLGDLAGGTTVVELNEALSAVVQAVRETGKVGSLSLSLKVKPNGAAGVIVEDEIKVRVPQVPRGETVFFATGDGSLVRSDPRQAELALRRVEGSVPGTG